MSKKALKKSVEDVVLAWSIEGICPDYHRCVKDRVRKVWPSLAHALDELSEEYQVNHD